MIRDEDATAPVQEAATIIDGEDGIKMEAKPQIVHAIAGGRTDDELKAFYREVHRKLAQHYPGTWLLVKDENQDKIMTKMEMKKEEQDEDDQMSEEEEEKELEREEEEMDQVEEMVKEEEEAEGEIVVKVEQPSAPQRRCNPDRRKRSKLDIKIEKNEEEGAAAGQAGAAPSTHTGIEKKEKTKKSNVCGGQTTVLASLISTVLSQNTTDRNSSAAWANLQRAYKGDWERVRTTKPSQLADVIRTGGLAQRKGGIIQGLLNQLHEERDGELSLEHLRDMPTEEVKQVLTKYKGIGPKTASCVLMFNMKRADFPVDTHVHRVSTRLGFVRGTTREQTYEFMNATMPDEIKRDMHVLLIRHGKQVCKARSPKCGECVLSDDCRYGQTLKKEQEMADINEEAGEEDGKKKGSNSGRKEKGGAGAAKTKGKKNAKHKHEKKEEDDDDEDFQEPTRSRRSKRTKAKDDTAAGGTIKRVAKRRRRSAPPASTIGDIEDVV